MKPTRYPSLLILSLLLLAGCDLMQPTDQRQSVARDARTRQLVREAEEYLDQGMLDSALSAFGLALEDNPTLTEAHMGMGNIYRDRGDYQLASHAFERAVETAPTDFNAHYYLGLMQQFLGRVREAINAYLRALAIDPERFEANRDLAAAYLQIGQVGSALPYAQRATELDPESQAAWSNLGATYSLLSQYGRAVDAYRQAAELGELADPVMLGLADAHLRLGNYQRAINVLEVLLRRSASAFAYERLGYAKFKLRRFDQGLANYRQALKLESDDVASLNGVGACLMTQYIQGDRSDLTLRDQAIRVWRRSVQIQSDQHRIIDLIARYYRL